MPWYGADIRDSTTTLSAKGAEAALVERHRVVQIVNEMRVQSSGTSVATEGAAVIAAWQRHFVTKIHEASKRARF